MVWFKENNKRPLAMAWPCCHCQVFSSFLRGRTNWTFSWRHALFQSAGCQHAATHYKAWRVQNKRVRAEGCWPQSEGARPPWVDDYWHKCMTGGVFLWNETFSLLGVKLTTHHQPKKQAPTHPPQVVKVGKRRRRKGKASMWDHKSLSLWSSIPVWTQRMNWAGVLLWKLVTSAARG